MIFLVRVSRGFTEYVVCHCLFICIKQCPETVLALYKCLQSQITWLRDSILCLNLCYTTDKTVLVIPFCRANMGVSKLGYYSLCEMLRLVISLSIIELTSQQLLLEYVRSPSEHGSAHFQSAIN